ncbi:MAG TPA: methionine--tRNA ligase [Firmicutes bacterium]|nr:methionine--tRNA ligase [Bacillota bacterium]
MDNIVVGGAWPYANGSLHIGHLAALLPGDVLARYFRAKGDRVFYVSGSDCHGTPITIRAKQVNATPDVISEHYHREFCAVFEKLGFSYDLYTKTSDPRHKEFVTEFHKRLYGSNYIEERTVKQAYCPSCKKILTDRLIVGTCPACGAATRGDQCDACGEVLDADTVVNATCADCGTPLSFGETTQLFLQISKLKQELCDFLEAHPYWRKNAIAFTKRYIDEGLRDRPITRDLDWGIDVPKAGYENKKIYIWAENVLGYLSATAILCHERGIDFKTVYGQDGRHYYVHGKDNIPFHTIILPSLLLAHGEGLHLPDDIISSEYMTLEGRKISTSQNWAVWAKDLMEDYDPDAIRYFFIANGPEKRDTDFSLREFKKQNNAELVGVWGNFVNRTLAFAVKYLDCDIPPVAVDTYIKERVLLLYNTVGTKIEKGAFREALEEIFEAVRFGNTYYDARRPWKTRTENPEECRNTISHCAYLIANIANLLHPFLPFSSAKVAEWLGITLQWKEQEVAVRQVPPDISILFSKIQ